MFVSAAIERLQSNALKTIWGWDKSYTTCLELAQIPRLSDRRHTAVINFATKAKNNPRYERWFPLNTRNDYDLRRREKYEVDFARHERTRNAPIHAMRRVLNELERHGEFGRGTEQEREPTGDQPAMPQDQDQIANT